MGIEIGLCEVGRIALDEDGDLVDLSRLFFVPVHIPEGITLDSDGTRGGTPPIEEHHQEVFFKVEKNASRFSGVARLGFHHLLGPMRSTRPRNDLLREHICSKNIFSVVEIKNDLIWIWKIGLIVGALLLDSDLSYYLTTGEGALSAIIRYGGPLSVLIACIALYASRRMDGDRG
ncbi:hypothetical protein J2129_002111 [Methanofollis sp. W23]|uniref:hypothetical protein n=1 Tax=Methanofollis sp. W23 TaxID=2817849 RepID=UPI001AE792A0|nr:hypothetical protein [Methanofollis sp. W23]MBP2146657.1 hypothetical protein [Methanofollis sp. W23]